MTKTKKKIVVLLTDDDANLRMLMRDTFEMEDFEFEEAYDGLQCLEKVQALPMNAVILLDIAMPNMDGIETYRKLREQPETQRTPVIFISAFPKPEALRSAIDSRECYFFQKPVDGPTVIDLIRKLSQSAE